METRDKLYRSIWEEDRKECDVPHFSIMYSFSELFRIIKLCVWKIVLCIFIYVFE